MEILQTQGWQDYELIDAGEGKRWERFGKKTLIRPDPQVIWKPLQPVNTWRADAVFTRTKGDQGVWKQYGEKFENWQMKYDELTLECRLSPFKHTGIFPEQSIQWDLISKTIKYTNRTINVLNLFAYTGIASLVAAKVGAKVTHVDASYPTIGWAKRNQELSQLQAAPIRWMLDDAGKFVTREIKRGVKYDIILMDPPAYGHGPEGERWDFPKDFPNLVNLCSQVLSDDPLLFIVNAYAVSISALTIQRVLQDSLARFKGNFSCGELALTDRKARLALSTGIFARWARA